MRREAAVPVDEELEAAIRGQQQRAADRWPGRHPHLFPALKTNAGGQHLVTYYSYRGLLKNWLDTCDVRDEHGGPPSPAGSSTATSRRKSSGSCSTIPQPR
jgi:hypothetical protein